MGFAFLFLRSNSSAFKTWKEKSSGRIKTTEVYDHIFRMPFHYEYPFFVVGIKAKRIKLEKDDAFLSEVLIYTT